MSRLRWLWGGLLIALYSSGCFAASAVSCKFDEAAQMPLNAYTVNNPLAVGPDTPNGTVILSLDYGRFLPALHLSCTSNGQVVPAAYDDYIYMNVMSVNNYMLRNSVDITTMNPGIKMRVYIKPISHNTDTLPDSYPPAVMAPGKTLGVEYPLNNTGSNSGTALFGFGGQYNADKTEFKYDAQYNNAVQAVRIELVKTGTITYDSSPVVVGGQLRYVIDGINDGSNNVFVYFGTGVYLAKPSCQLVNASTRVEMGQFFKKNQPYTGKKTLFNLDMTCSTQTNNMEVTFSDAMDLANTGTRLSVSNAQNGHTLDGVQIAVYDPSGKEIDMGTASNLGEMQAGITHTQFSAALVQTNSAITENGGDFSGDISGKANVTLTYY